MTNPRKSPKTLKVTAALIAGVMAYEGYVHFANIPVKGDVPTIGYGTTTYPDGSKVQLGDTTDKESAKRYLVSYLETADGKIKTCLPTAKMTQREYDIALDFGYQYGTTAFCKSSIAKHYNDNNYAAACESYMDYKYMKSNVYIKGFTKCNLKDPKSKWCFDCTTPGNKVCRGVGTRQENRYKACKEEIKNARP